MKGLLELADKFWPDWFIVSWAHAAIALGSVFVLIAIALGVRHFAYGHPMVSAKTREALTTLQMSLWLVLFGGGGVVFALVGVFILRWKAG